MKVILLALAISACGLAKKSGDTQTSVLEFHHISEIPPVPALIGGEVADPKEWPATFYADMGGARCTATLVGERSLLIAAHCVDQGASAAIVVAGTRYTSVCTHSKEYAGNDTADYTLCLLGKAVEGVPFERMNQDSSFVKLGDKITLTGYGCIKPGGGGGNDGLYRVGEATVTQLPSGDSNDIVTKGGAALCFGDSGGPAFKYLDSEKKKRRVISINSRGDIRTTSYLSSLSTAEGRRFLKAWSDKTGQKLCGVHEDAKGCRPEAGEPGPGPEPTECKVSFDKLGKCLFSTGMLAIAPDVCYQAAGKMFSCLEAKYK